MENLYWEELVSCENDELVSNDDENSNNVTTFLNGQNDAATLNVRQYLEDQDQMESMLVAWNNSCEKVVTTQWKIMQKVQKMRIHREKIEKKIDAVNLSLIKPKQKVIEMEAKLEMLKKNAPSGDEYMASCNKLVQIEKELTSVRSEKKNLLRIKEKIREKSKTLEELRSVQA